jgi:hypothetical protein
MNADDDKYLEWVEGYREWYVGQSELWGINLVACKILTLVASIASVLLAASISKEFFAEYGKILLTISTLLSLITSEFMAQFKVREMENLRESGRIEIEDICRFAHDSFDAFAQDRDRILVIKKDVREKIRKLEESQHKIFVDLDARPAKK